MSRAEVLLEDGRCRLRGELDFATVGGLFERGLALFDGRRELLLDLAGVSRANSAGLALLLEWLDRARERGLRLRLANLPPSLEAIARMSNLYERLPLAEG